MCDLTGSYQPAVSDLTNCDHSPDYFVIGAQMSLNKANHFEEKLCSVSVDKSLKGASSQRRASEITHALLLSASERRSRLQKQQTWEADCSTKSTLTPSMRKKYLKNLFLTNNTHSGLSSILSFKRQPSRDCEDASEEGITFWALDPMEHSWMLSVVDGNFNTIVEFLSQDPNLLIRKDFISGFNVLHWLAKSGKHEVLVKLLRHAEKRGYPTDVNIKGSGGLTPLHLAVMHSHYMVVKILVGAFGANVEIMDYNGKRAWQYLKDDAPSAMKELLGALDEHSNWQLNVNNNNCACITETTPTEEIKDSDVVDNFQYRNKVHRWFFGPFRKLIIPYISGEKN